ncbi:MAG: hypothetical protein J7K75_03830 [Desulfuromonas sp.]|nr:hypothetical protein [Desulfuromonas sp.]
MFKSIAVWLLQGLLRLRYRIDVDGIDDIKNGGRQGILFLPNHPALISISSREHRTLVVKLLGRPAGDGEQSKIGG